MQGGMGVIRRRYPRYLVSEEVCFVAPMVEMGRLRETGGKAEVVDRSIGGMCIKTVFPIEVGQVLRFTNQAEERRAVVKWVIKESSYRIAGLKFL